MTLSERHNALWSAALRLAMRETWKDVTLADIAREASMTLADVAPIASSKIEILELFQQHNDIAFLQSLESDPIEGSPHDRLFDAMLRRIELLTPHKQALRRIVTKPMEGPGDWLSLACRVLETQNWILTAAGINANGLRGNVQRLGLAKIFREVFMVWLEDDDPGIARTMATLDRKLRDGEILLRRLDVPISLLSGLIRAARAFRDERNRKTSTSDATAD